MKVGIITFHASHNYGSMLQAYALQQVVMSLGHECEIINFRTKRQRRCFKPFWGEYPKIDMFKTFVRFPRISYNAYAKYCLFETFLKEDLKLSEHEYNTYSDLEERAQGYDAYISGSDQIWNVSCYDWDMAYGLGFVRSGRKIAYAPSMGPRPEKEAFTQIERLDFLVNCIKKYGALSVREDGTAKIVEKLTGIKPDVVLDPTLLLSSSDWLKLEARDELIKGDYILLYTPWENESLYQEAISIGEKFKTKVVVTMHYGYMQHRNTPNVIFRVATGPKEFINLIRNARLVIGASFHAAAFAIILGRQLYAYHGMEDSRIMSLLSLSNLEQFAEKPKSLMSQEQLSVVYANVYPKIDVAADCSRKFVIKSLQ
ncbi:MAG: polysaccharide pyruvyl transferase family protein [Muribaculum sp.]|nr:polysaccharide pyruvyl transferase family protein [Muribaculum sp.]